MTNNALSVYGPLFYVVPCLILVVWAVINLVRKAAQSYRSRGLAKTAGLFVVFAVVVILGADKGPVIKPQAALQMCMAYLGKFYPGAAPIADKVGADLADTRARNADQSVSLAIDAGHLAEDLSVATLAALPDAKRCLIDLDWAHGDRAPSALNLLASQVYVESYISNGVTWETHYVAFSEEPSAAPQMYFQYYDAASESLVKAACLGFPVTVEVVTWANGAPRTNACYRMVNEVPEAYVTRSRTWDGEVLFGGPAGSAIQFEASGVFIINDANNSVWRGLTYTGAIGGEPVEFMNGIMIAPMAMAAAEAPLEQRASPSLFTRMADLMRAKPAVKKFTHTRDNIRMTQGTKKTDYRLGFKNNRKSKK